MKIIIAPDSFKECLPSRAVASAMAETAREVCHGADVVELPLADGGEGTVDILTAALGGTLRTATVSDSLGRPLTAPYGVVATAPSGVATARHGVDTARHGVSTAPLPLSAEAPSAPLNKSADGFSPVFPTVGAETEAADGFRAVFPTVGAEVGASGAADVSPETTAGALGIIEVAAACGLERLAAEERNPLVATSRGVGELIMAAYADGCRRFIIGLGGSATCDGGEGMLSVPGIKEVLRQAQFEVLCDVDAPFVGPLGAARVFAPQKGASPEDVEVLEKRMQARAAAILRETGRDVSAIPGAGAAGGLGGAFLAYANATLSPGISRVLDLVGFDDAMLGSGPGSGCAQDGDNAPVIVITGEGRSDLQTLQGKLPLGVLHRVRALTRAEAYQATQDLPSSSEVAPEAHRMPRAMQSANADALGAHSAPIVLLISGAVAPGARTALQEAGFSAVVEATPAGTPLSDALDPDFARRCIEHAVKAALRNCL